jgi:GNAT superfamily N-acetyltransferase
VDDAGEVSRALLETPLATGRIVLSALNADLLTSMTWLEAALAPEWTPVDLEAAVAGGNGVLIGDRDGAAIGVAVVLQDVPSAACATLPFLAIDPARRFRGLGGEAGLALDAHLRGHGFEKVYAPVPDGRGLAVYFWLRLGFRPLRTPDWPGPLVGLSPKTVHGIWMLRDGA